jgi:hypothetical protein
MQRSGFLDAREYQIDGRDPTRLDLPSRSTVKQIQLDWAGAPRLNWIMPRPNQGVAVRAEGSKLLGTLVHELPGALRDVVIAHVMVQQPIGADVRARLVSRVQFWKLNRAWEPKSPLDLTEMTAQTPAAGSGELWLNNLVPMSSGNFGMPTAPESKYFRTASDALTVASLYSELGIPDDAKNQTSQAVGVMRREAMQGLDVGRWFTEPCIIVIGFVGQGPGDAGSGAPVDISIDGKAVASAGTTCVRWVYPLPDNPPAFRGAGEAAESAAPK